MKKFCRSFDTNWPIFSRRDVTPSELQGYEKIRDSPLLQGLENHPLGNAPHHSIILAVKKMKNQRVCNPDIKKKLVS